MTVKKKLLLVLSGLVVIIVAAPVLVMVGLLIFLSPVRTLVQLSLEKEVTGIVLDCSTNAPVAGAALEMYGNGWGFSNGTLIWDKAYPAATTSNEKGLFRLQYKMGTEITTRAEKYHPATTYVSAGDSRTIRLLPVQESDADPTERTYDCKLASECYKTEVVDGVEISWNDCTDPNLNPTL